MADVSVRPAAASDVGEIARIQLLTWKTAYANVLPGQILSQLREPDLADGWRKALTAPPTSHHHVLIALEATTVVGYAAFGPDEDAQEGDPQAQSTQAITALLVEPRWGRRGHGSRLLAAVADTATIDGGKRLVAWVPVADTATLEFYRSAGWEADGMQRALDTGAGVVNELRLHAGLE